jgi:hypothetical protein
MLVSCLHLHSANAWYPNSNSIVCIAMVVNVHLTVTNATVQLDMWVSIAKLKRHLVVMACVIMVALVSHAW